MPPELLYNGRITTLHGPDAEALVVDGERVAFVGKRSDASGFSKETDLQGRRVIPGLIDMHAHLDREGLKSMFPAMGGVRTKRDVLERIAALARGAKPGEWIVTMPIGEPPFYFFPDSAAEKALYPTRLELDEAAPGNPVYIRPILGFWRWSPHPDTLVSAANSAALAAVGLGDDVKPPSPSVLLERDAKGRLTGRFFESTTASILELLYFSRRVAFSHEARVEGLRRSQAIANRYGITSIFEGHGVEPAVLAAYGDLHGRGELTVRAALCHSPSAARGNLAALLDELAAAKEGKALQMWGLFVNPLPREDDRIRAGCGHYTGFAGYHFDSAIAGSDLETLLAEMAQRGLRAVGLNRQLFPLFGKAGGRRWIVQHCGSLTDDEIDTARRLQLGLSFIPVEHIWKERGMGRGDRGWMPLRRLVDRGVNFTLATDNIPPSLFFAMWLCLARRNLSGDAVPDPDGPLERIEVLKAATLWSAQALGCDGERGSLAPGKLADLAVLDRDILQCPLDDIRDATAVATMRGGEWVYRRETQ